MPPISVYLKEQYGFIKESRKILFEYCSTITQDDFLNQNTSFGRGGSIRNLLVHIANTYGFWIGQHALGKKVPFSAYDSYPDMDSVITLFDIVDRMMHEFMENPEAEITYEINSIQKTATSFKLFSHVITHEFHHKGQILSLSRHLGYTPVDTDIVR